MPKGTRNIKVSYRSVDRYSKTRSFKTLEGAQKFAQEWVGKTPELGTGYAVSGDGIGKVTVDGATLTELFPKLAPSDSGTRRCTRYNEYIDSYDQPF